MTVYADYSYYTDSYLCGKSAAVTAAEFPYYARKASAEIDRYTFGNIPADDIPDEAKLCCCELAEIMHDNNAAHTGHMSGVASESVGGWSVSFEGADALREAHRAAVSECIRRWLSTTGFLYSGVS